MTQHPSAGTMPLIVLCGRTGRWKGKQSAAERALTGCKGAELVVEGRPMVAHVVDRMRATGAFVPVVVAGPASAYSRLSLDVPVLDTDGSFGENLRVALEAMHREHPDRPVAFVTCDVLPDAAELAELVEDYRRRPADVWVPVVRVDGTTLPVSSDWKPRYRIPDGEPAMQVLPAQLVIVNPVALRRRLLYRLFEVGYATRTLPLPRRIWSIGWRMVAALTHEDLGSLRRGELPRMWTCVLWDGVRVARRLSRGEATLSDLAQAVDRIFVVPNHRALYPGRAARFAVSRALSVALDIDTEDEAREFGAIPRSDRYGN